MWDASSSRSNKMHHEHDFGFDKILVALECEDPSLQPDETNSRRTNIDDTSTESEVGGSYTSTDFRVLSELTRLL